MASGRWAALAFPLLLPASAWAATPLSYLTGYGAKAGPVVTLTWGLLIISIAVIVIVSVLVLAGIWRRRATGANGAVRLVPLSPQGSGLGLLTVGVGVSSLVLVGSLVWTVVVLAAVNGPPKPPALTIEVTGQQWWWKFRYLGDQPSRVFVTADEMHIPVGQPIRIKLIGADVIHSFWVPALSGKTDAIPGQTNETWIEADQPGRYLGQCTEYCGQQHAHMSFAVIAEPKETFEDWYDAQLRPAAAPTSPRVASGEQLFVYRCGACHAVRGSEAGGTVAPDLTHLMSRHIIAGGILPNTIANLSGWIANPQAVKPGTRMPVLYLSGPELESVRGYLETLR